MKKMLIIKDVIDWFWSTFPNMKEAVSLDVNKIKEYFEKEGFTVEISSYLTFNFDNDYSEYIVLYGSYEDFHNKTKDYIEDVILWLEMQGAQVLPRFEYLRAHENKVMMELIKKSFKDERLKKIHTRTYASFDMLGDKEKEFPVVIKTPYGSSSIGVKLANNQSELNKIAKKFSETRDNISYIKRTFTKIRKINLNNSKFIVQTFIPNLSGDHKVLIFGDHYFVLSRLNRESDFRASGSGRFNNNINLNEELRGLLDFAKLCKKEIFAPHLSLDIAFDGKDYHLIEFQCVSFGFKTMSLATRYFVQCNNEWKQINEGVIPEYEFCYAVKHFLENKDIS